MDSLRIGSRVRVTGKHWLRAGAVGTVIGFDAERESSRWVVAFDREFPGGGYADENGRQCMRLQDGQLEEISDTKGGDAI